MINSVQFQPLHPNPQKLLYYRLFSHIHYRVVCRVVPVSGQLPLDQLGFLQLLDLLVVVYIFGTEVGLSHLSSNLEFVLHLLEIPDLGIRRHVGLDPFLPILRKQ